MPRQTTAEAMIDTLLAHGIDTLFALPGVHNDPLFDAVQQSGGRMRAIHPRHEQAGGYMALGAALSTGRAQLCAAVPGPGVLNMSAALLTALGMNAPVLAIAGQIPLPAIDRGLGHLHEIPDQLGLLGHITKQAVRVRGAAEAPEAVAGAVQAALSGRPGPVALEVPIDVWPRAATVAPAAPRAPLRPPADEDALDRAAAILGAAKRPLIVAGGGALDASAELLALAEMLEAPVLTFRRGRGAIPTTHRLAVPFPVGHKLWAEADAVLGVGTRLYWPQAWWGVDEGMRIVRIDIDPAEPGRLRKPDCAIVSDAAPALAGLLARLPRVSVARPSREEELARHRAWFAGRIARLEPQLGFLRAIREAMPEEGIFVEEVTQVGFASRLALPVTRPRTFLSPGYQDNLGWGYGAALGAKAANPDRPVLAIAGDGGFMYQAMELATAVRHNLAVVVVVFDDGAFGNVRRIQAEQYGNRLVASDLANPDFVRLAESFGVAAFRARTEAELGAALRRAFDLKAPALVHVPVGQMPSPWDMILLPRVRGADPQDGLRWP
jgi:acetolactate synthase-1/2/3 large subunit